MMTNIERGESGTQVGTNPGASTGCIIVPQQSMRFGEYQVLVSGFPETSPWGLRYIGSLSESALEAALKRTPDELSHDILKWAHLQPENAVIDGVPGAVGHMTWRLSNAVMKHLKTSQAQYTVPKEVTIAHLDDNYVPWTQIEPAFRIDIAAQLSELAGVEAATIPEPTPEHPTAHRMIGDVLVANSVDFAGENKLITHYSFQKNF